MANQIEYISPNNDREHLDKPKGQIGFYIFVCLPLYQCAARAMPLLQKNVDQIQKIWLCGKKLLQRKNKQTT